MTENIENLMLEHLKALRSEVAELRRGQDNIIQRLASIESHGHAVYGDVVRHSAGLDDLNARLSRVERRLELRDAQ